jgi:histidinol-phosphate/aromatic aminotransferase/cobyric acid decarboxylase-like protein
MALPILAAEAHTALVLDPMYGEYSSVLRELCGLRVHTHLLSRSNSYRLRPEDLFDCSGDVVALVNPNSPTGQHVPRAELAPVVEELARTRLVWIDETYSEYAGEFQSLEGLACTNPNIVVCKSMSKVYALSGLRVAYLVSHPARIAALSKVRPPWAVSLPAQVCASIALGEPLYYASRYEETIRLRRELRGQVAQLGLDVVEGCINSVLVHLPNGIEASDVCARAANAGVFLRDPSSMWASDPPPAIRISVRDRAENERIVRCLDDLVTVPVGPGGQSFCNSML